ncbi:hypothetical protein T458_07775 [Brevibacillus panacihumi W25]|uniref:Uncharacterized protein n=2 Tax=Brevibacillus panacihumi TaxID=497735 RepID=V6MBW1_9BACL|nr:hypothetical protein T458_07775 [Brevibacillus panacihumi W25]
MNLYEETRYFGKKSQRQQAGYCRVDDKRKEREEPKGKKTVGELTRVEIVYRPAEKIPMESLIQHPPQFNNLYFCQVLINENGGRSLKTKRSKKSTTAVLRT